MLEYAQYTIKKFGNSLHVILSKRDGFKIDDQITVALPATPAKRSLPYKLTHQVREIAREEAEKAIQEAKKTY